MSTTKHSPAPWIFETEPGDKELLIVGKDKMQLIAYVCPIPKEAEANAALLAAAPELLAYVKNIEFAIRMAGSQHQRGSIYTDAVNLIAKCGDSPLTKEDF